MDLPVILVLEWYPASRDYVLRRLLSSEADRWMDVLTCQDLDQAMRLAKALHTRICMVIIDGDRLEKVSAHQAVVQLRAEVPTTSIFVIVGKEADVSAQEWRNLGARFFEKKADAELESFLRRCFQKIATFITDAAGGDATIKY